MDKNNVQEKFDEFIGAYTQLSIDEQRKEIIEKLRLMITHFMMINNSLGRDHDLLMNRELADLNDKPLTEKDFLEGVFVYIHTLDDEVCDLMNYIIKNS